MIYTGMQAERIGCLIIYIMTSDSTLRIPINVCLYLMYIADKHTYDRQIHTHSPIRSCIIAHIQVKLLIKDFKGHTHTHIHVCMYHTHNLTI